MRDQGVKCDFLGDLCLERSLEILSWSYLQYDCCASHVCHSHTPKGKDLTGCYFLGGAGIFRCIKKSSQSVWTNFQTPELRVVVMSKLDKRLDRFWERRNKASYWLDLAKKTLVIRSISRGLYYLGCIKNPSCLGYIGDEILSYPVMWGLFHKPWNRDAYSTTGILWKVSGWVVFVARFGPKKPKGSFCTDKKKYIFGLGKGFLRNLCRLDCKKMRDTQQNSKSYIWPHLGLKLQDPQGFSFGGVLRPCC